MIHNNEYALNHKLPQAYLNATNNQPLAWLYERFPSFFEVHTNMYETPKTNGDPIILAHGCKEACLAAIRLYNMP